VYFQVQRRYRKLGVSLKRLSDTHPIHPAFHNSKETRRRSITEFPIDSRRLPMSVPTGVVIVDTCFPLAERMPRSVQVRVQDPRTNDVPLTLCPLLCRLRPHVSRNMRSFGTRLLRDDHGDGQHIAQAAQGYQNHSGPAKACFGHLQARAFAAHLAGSTSTPAHRSAVPLVARPRSSTASWNL